MSVFSGMTVATLLGVCLVPMLFVLVERLSGRSNNGSKTEELKGE
jgi:hypothetical protein